MNDMVERGRLERNPGRYTEDGSVNLTDVCRGLVDAIIIARCELRTVRPPYNPIPTHHVRRLQRRNEIAAPIERLIERLTAELRKLQAAGVEYPAALADASPDIGKEGIGNDVR